MRRFRDRSGQAWDVVVGRESWGAYYALFVPAGPTAGRPIRQTLLEADRPERAERELDRLDAVDLAELFERSAIKES